MTTLTTSAERIQVGDRAVSGDLVIPPGAQGLVIFAHGSGSSRMSPRNRWVAGSLQSGGLATLLVDLLTSDEEARDQLTGSFRFNIPFLAARLTEVTEWARRDPRLREMMVGYFGASTGAAAALEAAAVNPENVSAVVSRGGRPDLANLWLARVAAPTLLIVGGHDTQVIAMNRSAYASLTCEKRMEIVPGATHLFEEPGALEAVARLAGAWFASHLSRVYATADRSSS